jgi:polyisoprenoid-binding protein YceI
LRMYLFEATRDCCHGHGFAPAGFHLLVLELSYRRHGSWLGSIPTRTKHLATASVAIWLAITGTVPSFASSWKVDPARSRIGFSGTQTGQAFKGQFTNYQATIEFDPANLGAGHALIVLNLAGAKTGDIQRDEALPGEDWFDVGHFPKANFEVNKFTSKGANAYEAHGTLSIRKFSRDVVLPFTLEIKDGIAHAKGHLDLMRNLFGIGQNGWATDEYVSRGNRRRPGCDAGHVSQVTYCATRSAVTCNREPVQALLWCVAISWGRRAARRRSVCSR